MLTICVHNVYWLFVFNKGDLMFTKKLLTGLALITTLKLFCSVITLRELQELEPATRTAQTVNHSTQAVKPISYWPINLFSSAYSLSLIHI